MEWVILGVIVGFLVLRFMWKAYCHPAHVLARQAANMNWVAIGRVDDGNGYKNVQLSRDGLVAEISFLNGNVRLTEPIDQELFSDFIELEDWLVKSQNNVRRDSKKHSYS